MFTFLRMLPVQRLLFEQLPAMTMAWLIAESFYKWKSFTLEMLGFLATWFIFDAAIQGVRLLIAARSGGGAS